MEVALQAHGESLCVHSTRWVVPWRNPWAELSLPLQSTENCTVGVTYKRGHAFRSQS